jgi:saccharopepsin
MFGCFLGNKKDGEISFGGYNQERFVGNITWVPLFKRGYWELPLTGFFFRETEMKIVGRTAAIDTGSSLIIVPTVDAMLINDMIGANGYGSGIRSIDCNVADRLSNLVFKFGSYQFSLPANAYILRIDGQCVSSFIGADIVDNPKLWIIGDSFLRYYYSIYDIENERVGFAQSINTFINSTAKSAYSVCLILAMIFFS